MVRRAWKDSQAWRIAALIDAIGWTGLAETSAANGAALSRASGRMVFMTKVPFVG